MKVIAGPRGTGKTKQLLQEAYSHNGQVLTTNKHGLAEKARAYGLKDLPILDWSDMMYGEYNLTKPLYVHNIDKVFSELITVDFQDIPFEGFTVTLEE